MNTLKAWIGRHRLLLILLAFAAAVFIYSYLSQPNRPGAFADPKVSWNYWFDQGHYLNEAKSIRAGNLNPNNYYYPVGYPAIGALFVGVMHNNPFTLFNLAVFILVIGLYYVVARELFGPTTAFLSAAALILATPLVYYTVVPWTTTATLPAVMYLMYLAFVRPKLGYVEAVLLAAFLVLAYMARGGGEIVLLVPFGLAVIKKYWAQDQIWIKYGLIAAIFAVGLVINTVWTKAIFGSYSSPYITAVANIGFSIGRIPSSFWGTIIFSGRAGGYWQPLLGGAFWFIAAPVGMYLALRQTKNRWVNVGLVLSVLLGFAVTTSFNNYGASTLKYNSLHYLKIWFPALAMYSTAAIKSLLEQLS